jgi:hypothetical protein
MIDLPPLPRAPIKMLSDLQSGTMDVWPEHQLRAYGKACAAAALEVAAIKMEIAVDHLTSMSEGRGLIPGAAEGYKMALLVIEPMFREFIDARNLKD